MIWNRSAIFATLFPRSAGMAAIRAARRWRKAFGADPELAADLIRLGGVLAMTPPSGATAEQLSYEAGRRDFALQLLGAGGISPYELNRLMGDPDA